MGIRNTSHSPGDKPHACPHCTNRYTTLSGLRYHIQHTHTKGAAFVCSLCAKRFDTAARLAHHERVHEGAAVADICVLRCSVPGCTKAFTTRTGLAYHARYGHTPARASHACEHPACARAFTSRAGLVYHWRQQPSHHPDALRLLAVVPTVNITPPPVRALNGPATAAGSPARPLPFAAPDVGRDPLLVLAQELDEASAAMHADFALRQDPSLSVHPLAHAHLHMGGEPLGDEDDSAAIELGLAPRATGALGRALLD